MAEGSISFATIFSCILLGCYVSSDSSACGTGWFGINCQYRCHCANSDCRSDLPCTSCEKGWFGPDCQYVDLAYGNYYNYYKDKTLTDGNDTTCDHTNSVQFYFVKGYLFTWLRIHVSDAGTDFLHTLRVRFKPSSTLECANRRNATVDNRTLDIYCDLNETVQLVTLDGEGLKYLCSVYISGGRNVALKQVTNQSTTYLANSPKTGNRNITFLSSWAVDGNTSQDFYTSNTCSSTKEEEKRLSIAMWNVTFSVPKAVNRYVIYYRSGEADTRRVFVIRFFDENDRELTKHTGGWHRFDIYSANNGLETSPVSRVNIQARDTENIITLCEVEIFGDSVCKVGRYGRDCEHTCNCAGGEACFVSTGICPNGCAEGFYGNSCSQADEWSQGHTAVSDTWVLPAVGATIGVIVVVALLAAIIFIIMRRRKTTLSKKRFIPDSDVKRGTKYKTGSESALIEVGLNTPDTVRYIPSQLSAKSTENCSEAVTGKGGNNNFEDTDVDAAAAAAAQYSNFASEQRATAVLLGELGDFMKSRDRIFFQNQFNKIQANLSATMSVGLSEENMHKNRYKNICAYDHSRVQLMPNENLQHSDYINASYVEGYKSDESFIASQGPFKAILEDFVRMLWEQRVDKVVMLTNLVEDAKLKCERYWPEDGEMIIGEISVTLATTQVFADYTIRRLQLRKKGHKVQKVTHFHFTTWPDRDVPTGPWGLVDFEQKVASYPTTRPVVVHCSAGVGRTGTYIALRNIMRQAEETGYMDFFSTVQKLRRDRINMVQTVDQYIFLHKAALVAMLCIGTTVTSRDIQSRSHSLEEWSKSREIKMKSEFETICLAHAIMQKDISADGHPHTVREDNQSGQKNRFSSIVPRDLYRAILRCENTDHGAYINAVLVPSLTKRDHQILTQLPLPSTTTDFWRLVVQYKVTLVVAFEVDLKISDQTVGDYLPLPENGLATFSLFQVRTEAVNIQKYWKQDIVSLTLETDKQIEEHRLNHLTCTTTDLDPGFLLALLEQIRCLHSVGSGRVLYTCRNGATYSGLVCVLSLLLDRMDNDHSLTVPLIVGAIKAIRPEIIPTLEQYRILYKVLQLSSDSMGEYSNFGGTAS